MSFTKEKKRRTVAASALGEYPLTSSSRNCSSSSKAKATMREAQSRLSSPGMTRRNGFTAQSVSAMLNWAMGLRAGARKACIQNRTSAARMNRWKSASRTKAMASAITGTSVLAEGVAQLDRALPGRLHRVDEVLLHSGRLEHLQGRLRGPALGGDLCAQRGRVLPALDGELGGTHERPQGERPGGPVGQPHGLGRLLEGLDRIEDIRRAASRHR